MNARHLRVTNSFTVTVNESNRPPVLPAQTNLSMDELTLLVVTNTATDADEPKDALTYELLGEQQLKGKQAPVAAWRAVGVARLRGGLQRGTAPWRKWRVTSRTNSSLPGSFSAAW